jgi:hypothetical protein
MNNGPIYRAHFLKLFGYKTYSTTSYGENAGKDRTVSLAAIPKI